MMSSEWKRFRCAGCAAAATMLLLWVSGSQTFAGGVDAEKAKGLIKEYKCNGCHSIEAGGIQQVELVAEDKDKDEQEENDKDKKDPPDLSAVGKERDAGWMQRYLKKKEKIEGKKHSKRFKGTADELETLTAWLETLKDEAAAKKGDAKNKAAKGKKTKGKG